MSKNQVFYDRHQIGTHLVGMPENLQSAGANSVLGLDREHAVAEELNVNFDSQIIAIVGFYNASWDQRIFNKHIYNLHKELRRYRQEHGSGWLCWVNGENETTTTVNNESAGSSVKIEVVDVSLLDIQQGDYVLVFPPEQLSPWGIEGKAQVLEVTAVGAADFTVAALGTALPSGSSVYRILVGWEDAVFRKSNTGVPVEQAADFYRFQTEWEFITPKDPVISESE